MKYWHICLSGLLLFCFQPKPTDASRSFLAALREGYSHSHHGVRRMLNDTRRVQELSSSILSHETLEDLRDFAKGVDKGAFPKHVKIVEVSPRDGLQNEEKVLLPNQIVTFIQKLEKANLPVIEAGAFVSKKAVPAMAGTEEVMRLLQKKPRHTYPVLIPSVDALNQARALGVSDIAIFTSPSDLFNGRNIKKTTKESLEALKKIVSLSKQSTDPLYVRGYISCVLGCPYEGSMKPDRVGEVSMALLDMGCDEISLGDTIGVGTPETTEDLLSHLFDNLKLSPHQFAAHFHDTEKRALKNIIVALSHQIATVDCSVGGIGGCPFAKAAAQKCSADDSQKSVGNVATEKVIYMLDTLGVETDINFKALLEARSYILQCLNE